MPCHIDCRVAGWDLKYALCNDRIVVDGRRREGDMQDGLGSVDSAPRAGRDRSIVVTEV